MNSSGKQDLVSVVVPVYNVEPYLSECIESILGQTHANVELILVDDGSTDQSGAICDRFAESDARVCVIHTPNGGISHARNTGLDQVHGEWVMFVDSDDWIERDCVEQLLGSAGRETDAIACGYRACTGTVIDKEVRCKEQTYTGKAHIVEAYSSGELKKSFYVPTAKLYTVRLVNAIRFDRELVVGEDIVFNCEFLCQAKEIVTVDYIGYYLRNHANSTTHRIALKYSPLYEHGYDVIANKIFEVRRKMGIPEEVLREGQHQGYAQRYFDEVSNLFRSGSPYSPRERRKKIKEIHRDRTFVQEIKKRKWSSLSSAERVAWMSVRAGNALASYWMFSLVLRLSKKK